MRIAKRQFNAYSQATIALLLVGMVLLLNAMAASPSLHEWFHHDADSPEHQCAVTMFAHGKVDCTAVDAPAPASVTMIAAVPCLVLSVFRPVIDSLPAGRAPPVLPAAA